jgi:ribosomal protein L21E
MARITIEGTVYEGTPEELCEIFEMTGVKFPTEEFAEVEAPKFSVGNYVKITKDIYEYKNGDVVKITAEENGSNSFDFKVLNLSRGGYGFVSVNWIEKVSVEEAVSFEKWAKIGRKPNEFKNGDIVRVIDVSNSRHEVGDIGEITEFFGGTFRVNTHRISRVNWLGANHVELIAPVELRFDEAE